MFINTKVDEPNFWEEDEVDKPSRGKPLGRTYANIKETDTIKWYLKKSNKLDHEEPAYLHNLTEFNTAAYEIYVNDQIAADVTLEVGGVYTVLITETEDGEYTSELVTVVAPNSVNILWLIPQYVVMTLGEVMFSVTGLEFSYSQAPVTMKSVLSACWLLTVAFGNVIVVIIAELSLFESQANEFFLFAGLMFVDMILFMFMAYRYVPNDPNKPSETQPLTENASSDSDSDEPKKDGKSLDGGFDNKALSNE